MTQLVPFTWSGFLAGRGPFSGQSTEAPAEGYSSIEVDNGIASFSTMGISLNEFDPAVLGVKYKVAYVNIYQSIMWDETQRRAG